MAIPFTDQLALFVSLPRNDAELARAAVDAGADALKVHMNVGHRASGTEFGSFASHEDSFREILALGVPVGIVVGGEGTVSREEVRAARAAGFAFFDAYLHHAPTWYVEESPDDGAMVALAHDHPVERTAHLETLGIAAVEASLAAPEDYGTPLHLDRVADIARMRSATWLPIVVPSQHALTTDDIAPLVDVGVDALLVGAVVTGIAIDEVAHTVQTFRAAIDRRS